MSTSLPTEKELDTLLSNQKIIRYLTRKEFSRYISGTDRLGGYVYIRHLIQADQFNELQEKIKGYENALRSKPLEELEKLYEEMLEKERKEVELKNSQDELGRFFNAPSAKADSEHWSKIDYWTIDEAIALSFGKEAEIVNWTKVSYYVHNSAFAKKYSKLRDIVTRAKVCQEFSESVFPARFIEWAESKNITFDEEIKAKVYAQKKIVSWKLMYLELKKTFDEQISTSIKVMGEQKDLNKELFEEVIKLRLEIDELKKPVIEEKPLHKKKADSMLKIIAGLLVCNFGFKSVKSGETKAKEIADEILLNSGIEINDDTVREYFRKALEYLPKSLDEQK